MPTGNSADVLAPAKHGNPTPGVLAPASRASGSSEPETLETPRASGASEPETLETPKASEASEPEAPETSKAPEASEPEAPETPKASGASEPEAPETSKAPEAYVQLSDWVLDHIGRCDTGLLGSFDYTMRRRGKVAATSGQFDTAFTAFAAEMPE